MSDELETILAESLRTRAAHADTHGRGFGEVRRRVRRHRQRQMAAGLLPAVAGFGWIVTRPVADDPLTPGDAATGCGDTVPSSTWPHFSVTTVTWTGGATSTTVAPPPWTGGTSTLPEAILSSTVPGEVVNVGEVTDNTAAGATWPRVVYDSAGNPAVVDTTIGELLLTSSTASGEVTTTTIGSVSTTDPCDESSTVPPSSEPSGSSTTPMSPMPGEVTNVEQVYEVAHGDYLLLIANMFAVSPAAIADANGWPNGGTDHKLFPGDIIKIPAGAIVPLPSTTTTTTSID
ncbi:MAG: LysM domain-containing protein [Actinomycetota bacterium]|nr:LysM domain-containing protein [Actinomycetota bacterium]